MKLRLLTGLLAFALTSIAAHAQIGVYFNPVGVRISNSVADKGVLSFLGDGKKSQMFYGFNVGGYDDLYHRGKLEAGFDVRDMFVSGNNATLNSFLVGGRAAVSPFKRPLKPFVQGSVGLGTTRPPRNPAHVSRFQFGVFGGADYTLAKHVDFRVVEVGYGSVQTVSNETIGFTAIVPSAKLLSVSTGLVFRFR